MSKKTAFVTYLVAFTVAYDLMEYLYAAISGQPFVFSLFNYVSEPLIVAIITGYIFILRKKDQ
ncbi:MAG: hypothetical protein IKS17_09385 [Firmicutes bacterium]|nr:hypothetical protein [Bacillota bacterium]